MFCHLMLSLLPKWLLIRATVVFAATTGAWITATASFWLRLRLGFRLGEAVLGWRGGTGRAVIRRWRGAGGVLAVWRRVTVWAVAAWAFATRARYTFRPTKKEEEKLSKSTDKDHTIHLLLAKPGRGGRTRGRTLHGVCVAFVYWHEK